MPLIRSGECYQPAQDNVLHPGWEYSFHGRIWGSRLGDAGLGVEILIGRSGKLNRAVGNDEDKGLEIGV